MTQPPVTWFAMGQRKTETNNNGNGWEGKKAAPHNGTGGKEKNKLPHKQQKNKNGDSQKPAPPQGSCPERPLGTSDQRREVIALCEQTPHRSQYKTTNAFLCSLLLFRRPFFANPFCAYPFMYCPGVTNAHDTMRLVAYQKIASALEGKMSSKP